MPANHLQFVFPDDSRYDDARQAWNLAADLRPAVVALPSSVEDVVAAVDYAVERDLEIVVQGTGHGAASHGPLDGTILINMRELRGVEIDAERRGARVEAGALWEEVVVPAGEHGLTALHGSSPNVGVVGYSLGGGIGWLARKHGLSADSVVAVEHRDGGRRAACVPTGRRTPTSSGRCAAAAAASASSSRWRSPCIPSTSSSPG